MTYAELLERARDERYSDEYIGNLFRAVVVRDDEAVGALKEHPRPGDKWRSRDKRDCGVTVIVLAVDADGPDAYVYIKRFKRSKVKLSRWHSQYEFVERPDA